MKIYPYIEDASGNMPITLNLYSHDEPKHMHDYIELVYVFSGSGMHYVNDVPYHLSRGSLLFIDFGQVHEYTCLDNMSYVNFKLRPKYFSDALKEKLLLKIYFRFRNSESFRKQKTAIWRNLRGICALEQSSLYSLFSKKI